MIRHGTRWAYDGYGCRCDPCRIAKREYRRQFPDRRRNRNRPRPDNYVDEIAVERACRGDRSITLNRAETLAAFAYLDRHGYSLRRIAALLGVTDRCVSRWRSGEVDLPYSRPGEVA